MALPKEYKPRILKDLKNTDSIDVIPNDSEDRYNYIRKLTNTRQCGLLPWEPGAKPSDKTEQFKITQNNSVPSQVSEMFIEIAPKI